MAPTEIWISTVGAWTRVSSGPIRQILEVATINGRTALIVSMGGNSWNKPEPWYCFFSLVWDGMSVQRVPAMWNGHYFQSVRLRGIDPKKFPRPAGRQALERRSALADILLLL